MSERDHPRGVFQRPFDAIASIVVPVVADAVDPDDLVERIDVNGLIERIDIDAVVERIDVNALVARLDLDALLARVDLDGLIERVDLDNLVARFDVDAVVDSVDLGRIVARLDLNAIVDQVDVQRVLDRVDLDAVVDRVDLDAAVARVDLDAVADRIDVDRIVARVDVDAIAASLDIDAIVAQSTKGVFGRFIDLLRRQVVGIDEICMRAVNRILRRDLASLPTGPPLALGVDPNEDIELPAGADTMSGRYAGPVSRIGALGVDVFVISSTFTLLTAGLAYLIDMLFGTSVDPAESDGWIVGVALLLYGFSYFWLSQALTGQTISQAFVGIKVIRDDGRPLSPGAAAIRTVVLPFSFVLFGIGALMALVDRRRRALQDVAARSSVVYDWGDRPAALPAPLTRYLERKEASTPGAPGSGNGGV